MDKQGQSEGEQLSRIHIKELAVIPCHNATRTNLLKFKKRLLHLDNVVF